MDNKRTVQRGIDEESARQLRTFRAAEVRRRNRESVLAKRRQGIRPQQVSQQDNSGTVSPERQAAIEREIVEIITRIRDPTTNQQGVEQCVKTLRDALAKVQQHSGRENELVMTICARERLPEALVPLLSQASGVTNDEALVDAVWCITNLAAGSSEQTCCTFCTAPHLLQLVSTGHRKLAEQSAWALGNMAGEGQAGREALKAMGAIPVLVGVLKEKPLDENAAPTKRTCAWALCNLARGHESSSAPYIEADALSVLLEVLATYSRVQYESGRQVVIETAWCFSYLSAKEEECCEILLSKGILDLLVPILSRVLEQPSIDLELVLPVLRCVSNLLSLSPQTIKATLERYPCLIKVLALFLTPEVASKHQALCKEALWSVSNCCAANAGPTEKQLLDPLAPETDPLVVALLDEFLEPVCRHLTSSFFTMQKEAAFAVFNLASRPSPDALFKILNFHGPRHVLEVMLSFLRLPDVDLVKVAIDFVELVLAKLSNPFAASRLKGKSGSQLVLSFNGIEVLEELQFSSSVPEQLAVRAGQLVDRFFGEDYVEEEGDEEVALTDENTSFFFAGVAEDQPSSLPFYSPTPAATEPPPGLGRGRGLIKPAWMTAVNHKPNSKPEPMDQPKDDGEAEKGQTRLDDYFGS